MAIRCPSCGHDYDVTLFQFGRTIDCTCGARVGSEVGSRYVAAAGEPRFIADEMLTGLARWLRILGYDTACEHGLDDAAMVRRSYEEGRILITRDRKLGRDWRVPDLYVVQSEKPLAQLEEVAARYELRLGERLFTRCSRCNVVLEEVPAASVAPGVLPAGIRDDETVRCCRVCGRVYWEGSHVARMRRTLAARLDRQ